MDIDLIIFLILAVVVLFCFTAFALLCYSGLFYEPVVNSGETPWRKSAKVAYKFLKGPYNGNNLGSTFTEVTSIAPNAPSIGIFYDHPHKKAANRLRSIVGCIISETIDSEENEKNDQMIIKQHVTDDQLKMLAEKEFKTCLLPSVDLAVTTEFVYTTPFSLWLAPSRVYSLMERYIKDRGLCAYPFIEIYKDCKILYAAPLSKQEDFFVEECKLSQEEEEESDIEGDEQPKQQQMSNLLSEKIENIGLGESEAVSKKEAEEAHDSSSSSSFEEVDPDEISSRKSASPKTSESGDDKKNN